MSNVSERSRSAHGSGELEGFQQQSLGFNLLLTPSVLRTGYANDCAQGQPDT
ncbi:MAG: hypothetical protein VKJ46_01515 [Leptolyngbyaceae bacterium]|nr:hypothetical protein [Leptolyngbyaceae bacterium]